MQIPEQIVRQLVKASKAEMSSSVPPPATAAPLKIKMETGVPPPTRMAHLANKPAPLYPFDKMHAPKPDGSAASFFIECTEPEARKKLAQRLSAAAYSFCAYQKKHGKKPFKFTVRNIENGVRVWRIK